MRNFHAVWLAAGAAYFLGGAAEQAVAQSDKTAVIRMSSTAFQAGKPIPPECACDGLDISPPLEWTSLPEGTKSLALICDDPDAPSGTWVHWVIYNLPGTLKGLSEHTPPSPTLPAGAKQGVNDFKKTGYSGPCPPPGKAHRYFFKLYALDTEISLAPGATKAELLKAMRGHVIGEGQIAGTYQRKQ